MALCRCKDHPPKTNRYIKSVEPIGYPDTAAICGNIKCQNPGLIWLDSQETEEYNNGERIFDLNTRTVKIKVK